MSALTLLRRCMRRLTSHLTRNLPARVQGIGPQPKSGGNDVSPALLLRKLGADPLLPQHVNEVLPLKDTSVHITTSFKHTARQQSSRPARRRSFAARRWTTGPAFECEGGVKVPEVSGSARLQSLAKAVLEHLSESSSCEHSKCFKHPALAPGSALDARELQGKRHLVAGFQ